MAVDRGSRDRIAPACGGQARSASLADALATWQPGGMPNKLLVAAGSAVLVLIGAVAVAVRKARTEHPPVSPTVPRIEDVPTGASLHEPDGR